MRSSLIDVLHEDYIRTARAKGLSNRATLWYHGVRNALIPVLTILGLQFSFLVAGTVIIENVFYLPGLGRLVFQGITQRDLIVVKSTVMPAGHNYGSRYFPCRYCLRSHRPKIEAAYMNKEVPNYPEPIVYDRLSIWARALQSRSFLIGAMLATFVVAAGITSLFWTPYSIEDLVVSNRLKAPSHIFLLGTDHYGRDMLSMLMVGARTSISVALIAVGMGMGIGVPLGLLAATKRGGTEELVMRINDLILSFPSLLSAVLIMAVFGPSTVNAVIAIGIFNIPVFARVARGGALSLSGREFLLAARLSGKPSVLIVLEHILPNIANLLIVQATIQLSMAILSEAGLSYLGLGTQPPVASWGRMLFEAQTMVAFAPQLAVYPGLAIVVAVLGLIF